MHFLNFFYEQENIDESQPKPWATPFAKHQKSVHHLFDPKTEDFYYGVYKIKLILVIYGNIWNYFCEIFICEILGFWR